MGFKTNLPPRGDGFVSVHVTKYYCITLNGYNLFMYTHIFEKKLHLKSKLILSYIVLYTSTIIYKAIFTKERGICPLINTVLPLSTTFL